MSQTEDNTPDHDGDFGLWGVQTVLELPAQRNDPRLLCVDRHPLLGGHKTQPRLIIRTISNVAAVRMRPDVTKCRSAAPDSAKILTFAHHHPT